MKTVPPIAQHNTSVSQPLLTTSKAACVVNCLELALDLIRLFTILGAESNNISNKAALVVVEEATETRDLIG
jgi:hypothetical protein